MLGGGWNAGSSALVLGAQQAPVNHCWCCSSCVSAIERGETAALFVFDEELGLLFNAPKGLNIDLEAMQDSGKLFTESMDAAEIVARRVRAKSEGMRRSAQCSHRRGSTA